MIHSQAFCIFVTPDFSMIELQKSHLVRKVVAMFDMWEFFGVLGVGKTRLQLLTSPILSPNSERDIAAYLAFTQRYEMLCSCGLQSDVLPFEFYTNLLTPETLNRPIVLKGNKPQISTSEGVLTWSYLIEPGKSKTMPRGP